MTVADLLTRQNTTPDAFVLVLNNMFSPKIEYRNTVAVFDTYEQAVEFERACRLPRDPSKNHPATLSTWTLRRFDTWNGVEERRVDMVRSYRPDSILWDYNKPYSNDRFIGAAPRDLDTFNVAVNPVAPTGPIEYEHPERTLIEESITLLALWHETGNWEPFNAEV